MTDVDRPAGKLDLARVVQDIFTIIRGQPALLVITLLLSCLGAGFNYFNMRSLGVATPSPIPRFTPLVLSGGLVGIVVGMLYFTGLIAAAVGQLEGRTLSLKEVGEIALRRVLPVTGLAILSGFGVGFGLILFLVPGIILALMWFVSIPVVVAEPIGVFGAFTRSRALTRGNRWRLFGLYLLVLVLLLILEGVIIGGSFIFGPPQTLGVVRLVVISLVSGVANLVVYLMLSAVYVQLRDLKGGGESLARVFE
jgi:hypothetical protein